MKKNGYIPGWPPFEDFKKDMVNLFEEVQKPVKHGIHIMKESLLKLSNRVSGVENKLSNIELQLTNHVTDTNKKIDNLSKKVDQILQKVST